MNMQNANNADSGDDRTNSVPDDWLQQEAGFQEPVRSPVENGDWLERDAAPRSWVDESSGQGGTDPANPQDDSRTGRPRRVRLPVLLFLATCLSTFWVGANQWAPFPNYMPTRQALVAHWQDGLVYMACVLAILLTHEMGHFLATLRYRIPASFPFFIPFPISPIGTMGAVIGMDGMRANRKEMFDIGLAGPVAGLLVALPIMWIGISRLDLTHPVYGPYAVDLPLIMRLALGIIQPSGYEPGKLIWFSQLNPYFMAGWVGFLITGLNMLPVSQLDGGHVIYTLFGKRSHWIARGFIVVSCFYIVFMGQWQWTLMVLLVLFIGPDHPRTRDDQVPLGTFRFLFGCFGILIPLFCFAPRLLILP